MPDVRGFTYDGQQQEQEPATAPKQSIAQQSFVERGQILTAGNAFYPVHVQTMAGHGVGLYTVTTGRDHPSGAGLNLLYGSSFTTIRSHTTLADYIQRIEGQTQSQSCASFKCIYLDSFGLLPESVRRDSGRHTFCQVPPTTPDALTIIQDVHVVGYTHDDSFVAVGNHTKTSESVFDRCEQRSIFHSRLGPLPDVLTSERCDRAMIVKFPTMNRPQERLWPPYALILANRGGD